MSTIRIVDDNFEKTLWNDLVSHPLQSWEWGEIRKKEGKQIVRFVELQKGKASAAYLMTLHPLPFLSSYMIGYIPKSAVPSVELIRELKTYAQKNNIIFIKFEPNIEASSELAIPLPDSSESVGLVSSAHPLFTRWNQILDLTPSEEKLLSKMHPKTRYNIRLAQRKGVEVENMSTDAGYNIFERLYFETCKRQQYRGHTPAYHHTIWSHLSLPENDESPRSYIFTASYQGKTLSVFQLWRFKDVLYYVYGGSSEEDKSVMAPNLLMWEAIRFAKQIGCKTFDMWGSLPPKYDSKNSWAGFTRFKQGYGTKFIEYTGSYDLVINRPAYALYSAAHMLRSKLL